MSVQLWNCFYRDVSWHETCLNPDSVLPIKQAPFLLSWLPSDLNLALQSSPLHGSLSYRSDRCSPMFSRQSLSCFFFFFLFQINCHLLTLSAYPLHPWSTNSKSLRCYLCDNQFSPSFFFFFNNKKCDPLEKYFEFQRALSHWTYREKKILTKSYRLSSFHELSWKQKNTAQKKHYCKE